MSEKRAQATVRVWRRLTAKGAKVTPCLERAAAKARQILRAGPRGRGL